MIGSRSCAEVCNSFRTQVQDRSHSLGIGQNQIKSEFRLAHRVTWTQNKPSEANAFNAPLTPGMIVWQARGQLHSKQTIRTLSRPILLPANFGQ